MKRIPLSLFLFFLIYTSYSQTIPLEGLIASYSFSGNATDATNSRLNGIVNGAVLAPNRFNIANEAYYFNGTANIDITSNILRNPEYTYAAWVKPTDLPLISQLQSVISVGGNGGDQQFGVNNTYFTNTDSRAKFGTGGYIGDGINGANLWLEDQVEIGKWYFLTVVRSLDSLKMFVDGELKEAMPTIGTSPYYSSNLAKIGSRYNGIQGFKGAIDDVYIYNRAINNNEVKSLKKFGEPLSPTIDLTLKSQQTSRKVEIGSEIETKIVLRNQSQVTATNIKVHVNTPNATPFVRFVGSTPTRGEFNINSGLWQIPSLVSQDSVVLTLRYNPSEYGIWFVESEVFSSDQPDSDSTPSNQTQAEDDYARSCISVPIKVASSTFAGRQIIIQDPNLTNITWKKDGVILPNQTSNILQVTSVGSYTFESPNFICPTQGCCPYIFEVGPQTLCCEPLEYIYAGVTTSNLTTPSVLILQPGPNEGEDAEVSSVVPDAIYDKGVFMDPLAFSQFNGINIKRSFLKFNISSIPSNAIIDSAFLYLYFSQALVDQYPNFTGHLGDNEFKIQRVLTNWNVNSLTWNNQPSITSSNEVIVPRAINQKQNYKVDVKYLLSDILQNQNYGFGIRHTVEVPSKMTSLTTSEEVNSMIRPKLIVFYH